MVTDVEFGIVLPYRVGQVERHGNDTLPVRGGESSMKKMLREGRVHAVTFTSSSTVRNFCERIGARNFVAFSRKAI